VTTEEVEKLVNQAGQAIRAGKKLEARKMLEQILETDDSNEQAWLLLAAVVDTPRERRICLENVLEINPNNEKAKQALEKLRPSPASGNTPTPAATPSRPAATTSSASAPRATKQPPVTAPTKRPGETTQGAADAWRSQRNPGGINQTYLVLGLMAIAALAVGYFLASGGLNPPTVTATPSITVFAQKVPTKIPPTLTATLRGPIISPPPVQPGQVPPTFTPLPTNTLPPSLTPTPTLPPLSAYTLLFVGEGRNRSVPAIYTIQGSSGAPEKLLVGGDTVVTDPAWSPNGKLIAYVGFDKGREQLFIADANGSNSKLLTSFTQGKNVRTPDFSPDGSSIVFVADETGNDEIYVVKTDGSGLKRITDNNYPDLQPVFSPDGKQIAYAADPTRKNSLQIFVRPLDAKPTDKPTQLTVSGGQNYSPAYAPDGKHIAFVSTRERVLAKIYTMRADGSDEQLYTIGDGDANDTDPVYSPDGNYIAFVSTRNQIENLFIAPVFDGRNAVQVTNANGKSYRPRFQPGF